MKKSKDLSLHHKKMGDVLREAREEKGFSIGRLAIAASVSLVSIDHFERGVPNTLMVSDLFKVAGALDIDKFRFMTKIKTAYYTAEAELN